LGDKILLGFGGFLMSGVLLQVDKAILQDGRKVPANGNYPAKTQVKVIASSTEFYLSSETVDLTSFPVLEPVSLVASVIRVGGGKGFFVLSADAVEVKLLTPGKK
jgi:hypothetical protein